MADVRIHAPRRQVGDQPAVVARAITDRRRGGAAPDRPQPRPRADAPPARFRRRLVLKRESAHLSRHRFICSRLNQSSLGCVRPRSAERGLTQRTRSERWMRGTSLSRRWRCPRLAEASLEVTHQVKPVRTFPDATADLAIDETNHADARQLVQSVACRNVGDAELVLHDRNVQHRMRGQQPDDALHRRATGKGCSALSMMRSWSRKVPIRCAPAGDQRPNYGGTR
jgi:hypothetical protein